MDGVRPKLSNQDPKTHQSSPKHGDSPLSRRRSFVSDDDTDISETTEAQLEKKLLILLQSNKLPDSRREKKNRLSLDSGKPYSPMKYKTPIRKEKESQAIANSIDSNLSIISARTSSTNTCNNEYIAGRKKERKDKKGSKVIPNTNVGQSYCSGSSEDIHGESHGGSGTTDSPVMSPKAAAPVPSGVHGSVEEEGT